MVLFLAGMMPVWAQSATTAGAMPEPDAFQQATKTKLTPATISDLMGQGESCMKYSWTPLARGVCCWGTGCSRHVKRNGCCPGPTGWTKGDKFKIDYWEPSEVIEVSCRQGFSMLKPGLSGRGNKVPQSCVGFNKPGNSRWFFEARVWAINGYDGGLRHQAMGSMRGERARQCTEAQGTGDTKKGDVWGYGANKWKTFSRGGASGPGGSWEAYISDNDQTWAQDVGGTSSVPSQSACKAGAVDLANCWGSVNPTGWVSHPNPRVAAALVAWRAHTKALGMGKVSKPNGEGYKMAMDFPFPTYTGAYGQNMGMPGGSKTGSACFKPGDAGPEWWGGKDPEAIPALLKSLNEGKLTSVAEVNSGVYIFTVWVKTKCIRWDVNPKSPGGLPDLVNGGNLCTYQDKS